MIIDLSTLELEGNEMLHVLRKVHPTVKIILIAPQLNEELINLFGQKVIHGWFNSNFEPKVLEYKIQKIQNEKDNPLSDREIDILKMACAEFNSSEIADKLCINVRTVESHRKRIMEKTGSKNFIGSIIFALKHQLISIPQ